MKRIRIASTGVLLLLLGITAPIYAQQRKDEGKQDKQQHQDQNKRNASSNSSKTRTDINVSSNCGRTRTDSAAPSSRSIGLQITGDMCSKARNEPCGNSIAHVAGRPSTAPGSNVAATKASVFLKTLFVATLVRITGSESTASH